MPVKFLGSDFQINAFFSGSGLAGDQWFGQVTTLSDGRFAVVYQSDYMGNTFDPDVLRAIYNADGTSPLYGFVNGYAGAQDEPAVAPRLDGGFGVAFVNTQHADGTPDSNPNNITYVRVAANGFDGTPLAIGDFDGGFGHDNLLSPAIATLADGRQVVAFERVYTFFSDDDIYLNVVSADGLSTQFSPASPVVVAANGSWQSNAAVAATGDSAMVAYTDATGTTISSSNISAAIFDGDTNVLGPQITIADHADGLFIPKIAALDSHRFVIIYQDSTTPQIFGKIYDKTTNTLSAEFAVDQPGGNDGINAPAVAATPDGGFIVAWGGPASQADILARRFNSDGVAMGQQFVVNQLTDGGQGTPSVAVSGANVMFTWTDFAPRPGDSSPTSVRGRLMALTTLPDFNANAISDILWRDNSGALALWDMASGGDISSGGLLSSNGSVVAPSSDWSIAAISDFNGDGRSDVLWRDASGATSLWTMNGNAIVGSASLTAGGTAVNPDPSWSVAGTGDFNGDGMSDILWRNASGQLALWQMNGSSIIGSGSVSAGGVAVNPDPSWSVAGIGDFDGDGKSDILWRGASGEISLWEMNGSTVVGSGDVSAGGVVPRPGSSWSIAGIGDFNADGTADILWRDSASNSLVMWLMNGTSIVSSGAVSSGGSAVNPDQSWHVVEIGDFNDDARADILWRNDNGALAEWQMKGTSIVSSFTPTSGGVNVAPDGNWQTQAKPTDFA